MQNLLNRQHYGNPTLDPTSTNFGQVRAVTNGVMRFITFNSTFRSLTSTTTRRTSGFYRTSASALVQVRPG